MADLVELLTLLVLVILILVVYFRTRQSNELSPVFDSNQKVTETYQTMQEEYITFTFKLVNTSFTVEHKFHKHCSMKSSLIGICNKLHKFASSFLLIEENATH